MHTPDKKGDMRVPHLREVTVTQTHPESERGKAILRKGIKTSAANYKDYGQGAKRLISQTERKLKVWKPVIEDGDAWPTEIVYNISGTTYTIGADTVLYLDGSKTKPQYETQLHKNTVTLTL